MTDGVPSPDEVQRMLSSLGPQERSILKYRFALDGHEMHTLKETAEYFNVTRDQIRAVEAEAMGQLRRPPPR